MKSASDVLFDGVGEMRARCRALDWAATPLGPVAQWPAALQAAVRLDLDCVLGTCVFAGPEHVVIYNDAFVSSLDSTRHPSALGRPARAVWPEIWEQLAPELAQVLAGGVSVRRENVRFVLARDGRSSETFWTYALSPARAEDGSVVAVRSVATMPATFVERARSEAALRESEERFRTLFETMGQGYALSEIVRDEHGRAIDALLLELNPAYERLLGIRAEEARGRRVYELFPETDRWWLDNYERVVRGGKPERLEYKYNDLGVWFEAWVYPRGRDQFIVLFEDISERKLAAEHVRQNEERSAFLLTLSDALRSLAVPAAIEGTACRLLGEQVGADRAWYCEWREAEGYAAVSQDYTRSGLPSLVGRYPLTTFGWTLPLYERQPAIVIEDARTAGGISSGDRAATLAAKLVSWIAIPLVKDGELVGALNVGNAAPRVWTAAEVALVRETAERVWAAIERARAEAALRESEARYRTIVENIRDYAIFLLNASGIITEWTTGAERVKGYSAEEVLGRGVSMFYPPEEVASGDGQRELAEAAAKGRAEREAWQVRKDGTRFWADEVITAIRGSHGELLGFTVICRDQSERRRLQEQREQLLEAATVAQQHAEDANRGKDEFLAILSHELRTPLAAMSLWAHALRSGKVPQAELPRALDAITQSVEAQSRLIENLLDLSRLQFGKVQLERQSTRVGDVIDAVSEIIRPAAEAKGVTFALAVAGLDDCASLDSGRMAQVLWNLLTNAIKFTPRGGRVELRVPKHDAELVFEVADSGQGMDPDFLPHIFERFRQADMREVRVHGGLGIGLALCRYLVELHGGTIEARSPGLGAGSVFTVRVPWLEARPNTASETTLQRSSDSLSLSGSSVLLVEDDAQTRDAMKWTLERAGATVVAVGSGPEALAIHEATTGALPPEVMVCDIGLPGMSGYQLIESITAIRRSRGQKPVAACAVSAHARKEDQLRAIDAGFDCYLIKPVSAQRLVQAVDELAQVAAADIS